MIGRELQRIESATNTPILSHLAETLEGITTIRAYHQEARFTEIFFKRLEVHTVAFTILNSCNRWLGISLDYLGGVLVFLAILTALFVSTISCNQHMKHVITTNVDENANEKYQEVLQQEQQQQQNILLNLKYHKLTPTPSLVGLAINYTLLMPIYLNWVVKLLADMDLYTNSIERISYYLDVKDSETSATMTVMASKTSTAKELYEYEETCRIKDERKMGQSYCELNKKTMAIKELNKNCFNATVAKNRIVKANPNDKLLNMNVDDNSKEFISKANEINATFIATVNVQNDNDERNLIRNVFNKDTERKEMEHKEQYKDIDIINNKIERAVEKCGKVAVDETTATMVTLSNSIVADTATATATASIKPLLATVIATTTTIATVAIDECFNVDNNVIVTAIKNNRSNHNEKWTKKQLLFFKTVAQTSEFNDAQHVASLQHPFTSPFTFNRCCSHCSYCDGCCCACCCRRYYYSSTLLNKQYQSVPSLWPQHGNIVFENVSLGYTGQYSPVIKNLTLTIPAGQKIGICGRTGSGKSTLALSLFGVLQIFNGRIFIDDIDLALIYPDEIRNRLSIIPQDVHLFCTTIRENLDPYGYYADLELWHCLELAQLKEFITNKLPMGLDTIIGEEGVNLSLGHRQLLCLARAILRGSICLVLDEATSALDRATEKTLLRVAFQAFQGRTIIIIAHRLINMLDCDRIIVLENGQIIEDGTPQQLQQHTESIFSSLLHCEHSLSS